MKYRILTLQQLIDAKACDQHTEKFKNLFGEEVKITTTLCIKMAYVFDFDFAADKFLNKKERDKYYRIVNSMLDVYVHKRTILWDRYKYLDKKMVKEYENQMYILCATRSKIINSSSAKYKKIGKSMSLLRIKVNKEHNLLWDSYNDLISKLLDTYVKSKSSTWAKIYIKEV
jgi:hypothetical protein